MQCFKKSGDIYFRGIILRVVLMMSIIEIFPLSDRPEWLLCLCCLSGPGADQEFPDIHQGLNGLGPSVPPRL
jgi:hypothetical protein